MTPIAALPRAALYKLVVALLLGGIGRLLILNAPLLADGVLLRLDEAVVLLSALALGPLHGALTSLVATVGTGDRVFSLVWAIEPLLVAPAVAAGLAPVVAVTAFWLLTGGVVWLGLLQLPDVGVGFAFAVARQVVNGSLSAILAQAILSFDGVRRILALPKPTTDPEPLRAQIARAFVPVSTIPLILLALGLGRMYSAQLVVEGTRELTTAAEGSALRLADYVTAAEGDVRVLAAQLSRSGATPSTIKELLGIHAEGSRTFLRMHVADARGRVVAASPDLPDLANTPVMMDDRPYFTEPARTGRPFRSEGFRGRSYARDPIVVLTAPYFDAAGGFAGIAQGSLNLIALGEWMRQAAQMPGTSLVVLDRAGQVIASTDPASPPLLSDGRELPWVRATAGGRVATYSEGTAVTIGGARREHVAVRKEVAGLGWQVHVRRPLAAMQAPLESFYVLTAGWLLFCVSIALLMSGRVARHITQPLEVLARTAESVGRSRAAMPENLPPTAPAEVRLLERELSAMVARLDESVKLLDQKVRERTTELSAATARNDTIFRTASDGMVVLDAERRIIEANDPFCRLVGLPHDQVLSRSMRDFELGVTDDLRRQREANHARTGTSRFESAMRTNSGDAVPVEIVVTNMPGGGGRVFAGIRDISERRRAETERAHLESRLRQSQKMEAIGTLAGGIAHDFNNILTLITGSADLAALDVPDGHPARQYLEQIGRASARAEALVRQILTFSRRRDEQREVVALGPIVREAADILRSTLPAMVEIRVQIDERVPAVQADPVQLHQVLMNLGSNAAHAMRESGGMLAITLTSDGANAVLVVADTGDGMDRATLDRVFEPFFTTKPVGAGTGLGLSVVHGIVTGHGGAIEVSSDTGRGTTFRITLPAATHTAATPGAEGPADEEPTSHRPAHVLVVDDEPELVGLMCRQLARLGYTTQGCAGPGEALDRLRAAGPAIDVVVSDLAMPKMSGIELAEVIHHERPNLPIVLCSGRVTDEDRVRAQQAGVAEFLNKPFGSRQLAGAVARSLGAEGTRH
jgi:PAS domain S-box-containing protein